MTDVIEGIRIDLDQRVHNITLSQNSRFVQIIGDKNPIHDPNELDAFFLFKRLCQNDDRKYDDFRGRQKFFDFFRENEHKKLTDADIKTLYSDESKEYLELMLQNSKIRIAVVAGNLVTSLGYASVKKDGDYLAMMDARYKYTLFVGKKGVQIHIREAENGKGYLISDGKGNDLVGLTLDFNDIPKDRTDHEFPYVGCETRDGRLSKEDVDEYDFIVGLYQDERIDPKTFESLIAAKTLSCQKEILQHSPEIWEKLQKGELSPVYMSQLVSANSKANLEKGDSYDVYVQVSKQKERRDAHMFTLATGLKVRDGPILTGEAKIWLIPNIEY